MTPQCLVAWDHPEQPTWPRPCWPRTNAFSLQVELQRALKITGESRKRITWAHSLPAMKNFPEETKLFHRKQWEHEIWKEHGPHSDKSVIHWYSRNSVQYSDTVMAQRKHSGMKTGRLNKSNTQNSSTAPHACATQTQKTLCMFLDWGETINSTTGEGLWTGIALVQESTMSSTNMMSNSKSEALVWTQKWQELKWNTRQAFALRI